MDYYGHLYHSTVLSCENAHRDACAQQGEPRRREKCRKYEKSSRKARVRPAREARAAAGAWKRDATDLSTRQLARQRLVTPAAAEFHVSHVHLALLPPDA